MTSPKQSSKGEKGRMKEGNSRLRALTGDDGSPRLRTLENYGNLRISPQRKAFEPHLNGPGVYPPPPAPLLPSPNASLALVPWPYFSQSEIIPLHDDNSRKSKKSEEAAHSARSRKRLKQIVSDKFEARGGEKITGHFTSAVRKSENIVEKQVHKKFFVGTSRHYLGSSKYKGVCFNNSKQKWRARISREGKRQFLGDWDSEYEAALAYDEKLMELFKGDLDLKERLNFPEHLITAVESAVNSTTDRNSKQKFQAATPDDQNIHQIFFNNHMCSVPSQSNLLYPSPQQMVQHSTNWVDGTHFATNSSKRKMLFSPTSSSLLNFSDPSREMCRKRADLDKALQKENLHKFVAENVQARGGIGCSNDFDTATKCSENVVQNQVHKKYVIGARRFYTGSSKYKGVCFNRLKKKWRARITSKGTRQFLGDWNTELEAALAYDQRIIQLFRESGDLTGRLNFPSKSKLIEKV